ncbi:tyrosine-type recombinase/integrase [Nostoc sp. PCC 9305]|uniref:tyrosine-type recombinase/integrase n=1 Tax=Nostoc sp. PCC 9305 TaxID=296636 RepID=UPI0039C62C7C
MRYILKAESNDRRGARRKLYCIIAGSAVLYGIFLPNMITKDEFFAIIQKLYEVHQLLMKLLYGTGFRLNEALNFRVKDIDFAQNQITVRDTKGNESRVTMLPESVAEELKIHLQSVKIIHNQDLEKG